MKKIMICIVIFLSACFSSANKDLISPMEQKSLVNYVEIIPYDNGFYYLDDNLQLNYYDLNQSESLMIGSMDEKTDAYQYSYMGSTVYLYDHSLWYITNYRNDEGSAYSSLAMQSKDGKSIKSVFDFSYPVTQFLIHDNYVICSEVLEDGSCKIHIHNLNGKEVKEIQEESYVDHLIADQQRVFYTTIESDHMVLKYVNLDDFSNFVMDLNQQTFLFENDNKVSLYTTSMVDDDFMIHSCIQELDTNEIVFDVSDAIVNYFDDQYIYTSSAKNRDIYYRIYDWNGNMVKEIVPSSEFLDDTYETNNMFWKTNGSQIIRIVDGNIVAITTKNKVDHLYVCQISDGSCKYAN